MKKPAPTPPLVPCPTCGLPVEAGGMRGVAHHDCGWVLAMVNALKEQTEPVTPGEIRQVLLQRLRKLATTAEAREALDILNALKQFEPADGPGPRDGNRDGDMETWLRAGSDRPF